MAESLDPTVLAAKQPTQWWFKDSGLRKMYILLLVALLSSATNGYDG